MTTTISMSMMRSAKMVESEVKTGMGGSTRVARNARATSPSRAGRMLFTM
ncbi:MAG: hypothetical protein M5R40_01675 [Anaerolineae bacterium]|nr:hypothetical protein [Anaerolineae bacterium]